MQIKIVPSTQPSEIPTIVDVSMLEWMDVMGVCVGGGPAVEVVPLVVGWLVLLEVGCAVSAANCAESVTEIVVATSMTFGWLEPVCDGK